MEAKLLLRISTAFVLIAAGAVVFFSKPSTNDFSLAPPPEAVTPEIVASRGCLEGVEHPSERDLSLLEQFSACDDYVQITDDKVGATYFRALNLYQFGISDVHREKAYDDFSFVIDAGEEIAAAFANRAFLNVRYRDNFDEALLDINQAITLKAGNPRARYFEHRALILLEIARRDTDENLVYDALDDVQMALSIDPDSRLAPKLENWASEFLRFLHQSDGRAVQKG